MHPEILQVVEDAYRDRAIRCIVEAIAYEPWYGIDASDVQWLRDYLSNLYNRGLVQRPQLELCGLAAARHRKGVHFGDERKSEGALSADDVLLLRAICFLADRGAGTQTDSAESEARCRRVFRLYLTGHRDPAEILALVSKQ